jgi:hypothetical protein
VKSELEARITNKLVVTHDGYSDFSSFGMCISDWDIFDLQSKFQQQTGVNKHGLPVLQPISLRRLAFHFLGIDIQKGVHDCVVDAQYTMKLFREYQKLARERNVNNRFANFEENEFDEVKKMK